MIKLCKCHDEAGAIARNTATLMEWRRRRRAHRLMTEYPCDLILEHATCGPVNVDANGAPV